MVLILPRLNFLFICCGEQQKIGIGSNLQEKQEEICQQQVDEVADIEVAADIGEGKDKMTQSIYSDCRSPGNPHNTL